MELGYSPIQRSRTLAAALAFVAMNSAVLSAAFLGEWPHPCHGLAFELIVGEIRVSAKR